MWKKSPNPKVEELTKSWTARSVQLDRLRPIKLEDGSRFCVWCQENKLGKHPNQKYCSESCSDSAFAWANPQKEAGLGYLLIRQNFCCNVCQHDWKPFIEESVIGRYYGVKDRTLLNSYREKYSFWLVKKLKEALHVKERTLVPEVDHIVPISKGGTSLGLDNHQAICYACHKAKSKIDNSGPRKKKVDK